MCYNFLVTVGILRYIHRHSSIVIYPSGSIFDIQHHVKVPKATLY
jgi:hypothetical protein